MVFLFFDAVLFGVELGFGLFIPGILDISCWARTDTPPTKRIAANTRPDNLTTNVELSALMLLIVPLDKTCSEEISQ